MALPRKQLLDKEILEALVERVSKTAPPHAIHLSNVELRAIVRTLREMDKSLNMKVGACPNCGSLSPWRCGCEPGDEE